MHCAHHGGAEYDLGKTVEFKGKLTRVELINPHSWIYFDVTEKDGKVSHHRCEMRSVHVLRRSGWTKELFPVGQQVTIEASPNRTDPASCYLQTIVAADGTRMDRYGQYIKAPQGGVQEVRGPHRRAEKQAAGAASIGRAEHMRATGRRCRWSW